PEEVDLDALVREIGESLAFDLERAGIRLGVAKPLPKVFAEKTRMRQVFQNLLDNAIKYMLDAPRREVRIDWQDGRDADAAAHAGRVLPEGPEGLGTHLIFTVSD